MDIKSCQFMWYTLKIVPSYSLFGEKQCGAWFMLAFCYIQFYTSMWGFVLREFIREKPWNKLDLKKGLKNRMEDKLLVDSLFVCIDRAITKTLL